MILPVLRFWRDTDLDLKILDFNDFLIRHCHGENFEKVDYSSSCWIRVLEAFVLDFLEIFTIKILRKVDDSSSYHRVVEVQDSDF